MAPNQYGNLIVCKHFGKFKKMEILSPRSQSLTIEARHTISQEVSKQRRLKVAKSIFLPRSPLKQIMPKEADKPKELNNSLTNCSDSRQNINKLSLVPVITSQVHSLMAPVKSKTNTQKDTQAKKPARRPRPKADAKSKKPTTSPKQSKPEPVSKPILIPCQVIQHYTEAKSETKSKTKTEPLDFSKSSPNPIIELSSDEEKVYVLPKQENLPRIKWTPKKCKFPECSPRPILAPPNVRVEPVKVPNTVYKTQKTNVVTPVSLYPGLNQPDMNKWVNTLTDTYSTSFRPLIQSNSQMRHPPNDGHANTKSPPQPVIEKPIPKRNHSSPVYITNCPSSEAVKCPPVQHHSPVIPHQTPTQHYHTHPLTSVHQEDMSGFDNMHEFYQRMHAFYQSMINTNVPAIQSNGYWSQDERPPTAFQPGYPMSHQPENVWSRPQPQMTEHNTAKRDILLQQLYRQNAANHANQNNHSKHNNYINHNKPTNHTNHNSCCNCTSHTADHNNYTNHNNPTKHNIATKRKISTNPVKPTKPTKHIKQIDDNNYINHNYQSNHPAHLAYSAGCRPAFHQIPHPAYAAQTQFRPHQYHLQQQQHQEQQHQLRSIMPSYRLAHNYPTANDSPPSIGNKVTANYTNLINCLQKPRNDATTSNQSNVYLARQRYPERRQQ